MYTMNIDLQRELAKKAKKIDDKRKYRITSKELISYGFEEIKTLQTYRYAFETPETWGKGNCFIYVYLCNDGTLGSVDLVRASKCKNDYCACANCSNFKYQGCQVPYIRNMKNLKTLIKLCDGEIV